ncbi:MAG TPA: deoxyribonuclease IV [Thermoanaerobaculia bacterium]
MTRFQFPDAPGDLIGAHLSTKGGVCTIFERARRVDARAIALFSKNASQWKAKPLEDEICADFKRLRAELGNPPVIVHAAYLINLATTNAEFLAKSIAGMIDELERAERLGAHAVVLHPGAHMGAGVEEGVDQIARSLDAVHAAIPENRVVTLLETAAGQGSCLGCTYAELGAILRRVDDPSRLGICIDTCHVFSAGYDIRTQEGWNRMIDEVEREVGLENVGAFHLNDSKKPLGSRVDRHQHIGDGEIGLGPFGFVLNDPRFARIPKVLETPKPDEFETDIRNLAKLRSLLR